VNGGLRKECVRAANVARTVERGRNAEDGTGEGLAILTFRKEPQGTERVTRGTRRRRARGSKNPRRGNTELLDVSIARAGGTKLALGQPRRGSTLKGKGTPGEDLPGPWFWKSGRSWKTPRLYRTARGERLKPQGRYAADTKNL